MCNSVTFVWEKNLLSKGREKPLGKLSVQTVNVSVCNQDSVSQRLLQGDRKTSNVELDDLGCLFQQ